MTRPSQRWSLCLEHLAMYETARRLGVGDIVTVMDIDDNCALCEEERAREEDEEACIGTQEMYRRQEMGNR